MNINEYVTNLSKCLQEAKTPIEAVEIAEITGLFSKTELMKIMTKKMHEQNHD